MRCTNISEAPSRAEGYLRSVMDHSQQEAAVALILRLREARADIEQRQLPLQLSNIATLAKTALMGYSNQQAGYCGPELLRQVIAAWGKIVANTSLASTPTALTSHYSNQQYPSDSSRQVGLDGGLLNAPTQEENATKSTHHNIAATEEQVLRQADGNIDLEKLVPTEERVDDVFDGISAGLGLTSDQNLESDTHTWIDGLLQMEEENSFNSNVPELFEVIGTSESQTYPGTSGACEVVPFTKKHEGKGMSLKRNAPDESVPYRSQIKSKQKSSLSIAGGRHDQSSTALPALEDALSPTIASKSLFFTASPPTETFHQGPEQMERWLEWSQPSNFEGDQLCTAGTTKRSRRTTRDKARVARLRRRQINARIFALQDLVPHSKNLDTVKLLDQAIQYVRTLQKEIVRKEHTR